LGHALALGLDALDQLPPLGRLLGRAVWVVRHHQASIFPRPFRDTAGQVHLDHVLTKVRIAASRHREDVFHPTPSNPNFRTLPMIFGWKRHAR
jgi:hypothetical protein